MILVLVLNLNKITLVRNKIDLDPTLPKDTPSCPVLDISAQTGQGIKALRQHLKTCMGFEGTTESQFSARQQPFRCISA